MPLHSLTEQGEAGWSGEWVQPHHLHENVFVSVLSCFVVFFCFLLFFVLFCCILLFCFVDIASLWGGDEFLRLSKFNSVNGPWTIMYTLSLWCFISVFEQGSKGNLGLPGLPGPAGYTGQKGDRVRLLQAKSWASNNPREHVPQLKPQNSVLSFLHIASVMLVIVYCCPIKQ